MLPNTHQKESTCYYLCSRKEDLPLKNKISFEYCTSKWKHEVSSVSALVITHCDNDDESDRQGSSTRTYY